MKKILVLLVMAFSITCANAQSLIKNKLNLFSMGTEYNYSTERFGIGLDLSIYSIYLKFSTSLDRTKESMYGHGGYGGTGFKEISAGYAFNIVKSKNIKKPFAIFITPNIGLDINSDYYEDSYYGKTKYYNNKVCLSYGCKFDFVFNKLDVGIYASNKSAYIGIGVCVFND